RSGPGCRGARARARRCGGGVEGVIVATSVDPWWIDLIKALVIINLLMVAFAYSTWLERKVLSRMQLRYGPNRAGPYGLLQPIADLIKLIRKESFFPTAAIDLPYIVAPVVAAFTALAAFAGIRYGNGWDIS